MLKRLVIAAVLAFGIQGAHAATLDGVDVVSGVDSLIGTGSVTADGLGGVSFSGTGAFQTIFFFAVSATDTSFVASSITDSLTAGGPMDEASSTGLVQFLYSATSNTLGSDFDLFRVSIFHDAGDFFAVAQQVPIDARISVQAVNAIPLPAGIWLTLSGFGGLLYLGRRRA